MLIRMVHVQIELLEKEKNYRQYWHYFVSYKSRYLAHKDLSGISKLPPSLSVRHGFQRFLMRQFANTTSSNRKRVHRITNRILKAQKTISSAHLSTLICH